MKAIITVSGMVLAAAAAAVLVSTSRLGPVPRERPLHLAPAPRLRAEGATRRRCVHLGWKAPYWYAGVPRNGISTQNTPSR